MSTSYIPSYFADFAQLSEPTQKYLKSTLEVYDRSALLELVVSIGKRGKVVTQVGGAELELLELDLQEQRKLLAQMPIELANTLDVRFASEVRAKIEHIEASIKKLNYKRGVSSWHDGDFCLFDSAEIEREVNFFRRFGSLMAVPSKQKPFVEIRLNLVAAHELAHQLQELLLPDWVNKLGLTYRELRHSCSHVGDASSSSELILPTELEARHFVSGFARSSLWNFIAEGFACFSDKESSSDLKTVNSDVYAQISNIFLRPEKAFKPSWAERLNQMRAARNISVESIQLFLKKYE